MPPSSLSPVIAAPKLRSPLIAIYMADRSGKDVEQATRGLVPSHTQYSKIFTLGARWDPTPNIMLRAEYQRHNGTFILSSRENPDPSELDPDWDMFSISASYRF